MRRLTELGRAQARSIGERLVDVHFDGIVRSWRRRAVETASILAASIGGPAPRHSAHADDRTPFPSDRSSEPHELRPFLNGVPADERDEDGRDLDRAVAGLSRVEPADRRTLVVTHNFVIGWLVRDALDAPSIRWTGLNSANGGLTIIRYEIDRPPQLIGFNHTERLATT